MGVPDGVVVGGGSVLDAEEPTDAVPVMDLVGVIVFVMVAVGDFVMGAVTEDVSVFDGVCVIVLLGVFDAVCVSVIVLVGVIVTVAVAV